MDAVLTLLLTEFDVLDVFLTCWKEENLVENSENSMLKFSLHFPCHHIIACNVKRS